MRRTVLGAVLLVVAGCGGGNANNLEGRYLADCTTTQKGQYTAYSSGIAGTAQDTTITDQDDQRDFVVEKGAEEGAVIRGASCTIKLEPDGNEDLEMTKDTDCESSFNETDTQGTAMGTYRDSTSITWTTFTVTRGSKANTIQISGEGEFTATQFQNDEQQYAYSGTIELDCDAQKVAGE